MRTAHLQIRLSPEEKAAIGRAARRADLGMSAYVLGKVLPSQQGRWSELLEGVSRAEGGRIAIAALSSWLAGLGAAELRGAVQARLPAGFSSFEANTVAAMVESACAGRGVEPPPWTRDIAPLEQPVFGSALASLRLHLLTNSPAPFRRRNLFVDTVVGGQV